MISCWIFRSAIERHAEKGAQISVRARRHLDGCAECDEMLRVHAAVTVGLRKTAAQEREKIEVPFLTPKIMRALESGAGRTHSMALRAVGIAGTFAALVVAVIALSHERRENAVKVEAPSWEAPTFKAPQVATLETELDLLKADTQRAARALAVSFLPSDR